MKRMRSGFLPRHILAAGLAALMLTSSAVFGNVSVSAAGNSTKKNSPVLVGGKGTAIISDYSVAHGTVSDRLFAGARTVAYVDSYGGEFTGDSLTQETYSRLYQEFAVDKANDIIVIDLDPPVLVEGAVVIENNTVSVDEDNPAFVAAVNDLLTSVARGCVAFTYDHPEVFWVRNHITNYRYGAVQTGDDTFAAQIIQLSVAMQPSYSGAYGERSTVTSGIDTAVSRIPQGETRYETLKNIHDYVCDHSTYNYPAAATNEASDAHTAAPLFNGKETFVCEGYSKSFKVLCDRFNIPCALVQGDGVVSSGNEPHMWNYVKMDDGNWYGVDVTWDDSGDNVDYNDYNWFLKGGDEFEIDHKASGIVTDNNAIQLVYPRLAGDNYDPNASHESSEPEVSEPVPSEPVPSEPVPSEPVPSEPVPSEPVPSEPVPSEPVPSEPVPSEPVPSEPVPSEPVPSEPVASQPVASEPVASQPVTSATSSDDEQPKRINVPIDNPDNGFVKSASLPETAKAKAGNDDVALNKIRLIVTKLDSTKKKALTDAIKQANGNLDLDQALVDAYDIQLVDQNGNTVTITEGKLKVCLAFPSGMTKKYSSYYYYLYHQKTEGGVERIPSVNYNAQGVWFENDKFSPYALVGVDKGEPSPGTGETILYTVLAIILLGLAAGAIAFVVVKGRRGTDDEDNEKSEGGREE